MNQIKVFFSLVTSVLAVGTFISAKSAAKKTALVYCTVGGALATNFQSCVAKIALPPVPILVLPATKPFTLANL